jgi:23S rRNA pseudouridine2605 synthase
MIRLNKFIAEKTGVSRRQADLLIAAGRVEINGKIAVLGQKIAENATICVDGQSISTVVEPITILLNKPVGYLSSRRSQGGDPTVYDLLPAEYKKLKTAGRLDKDSSGLMILSSDGDLIQRLTHPRYQKTKIYEIKLDKPLEPLHQQMISDFGVDLPDGKSQLILEKLDKDKPHGLLRYARNDGTGYNDRTTWQVTMHEGRNRQIRRTFAALGYKITKLHRTHLGPYSLGKLKTGKFIILHIIQ